MTVLDSIVARAPVFLLVVARCLGLVLTLPLFSTRTISSVPKVALSAYMAFFISAHMSVQSGTFEAYRSFISPEGNFSLDYVLVLVGEAMIGVTMGFFVSLIFASFSTAGQFFAFQMGFSAAEAYDSLSQVENPLMGQYLNLIAMLVFMQNHWFQTLFLGALSTSFQAFNVFAVIENGEHFLRFMLSGLSLLFRNALVVALPIMGTLFLLNVAMGVLSKAAPQMNLLSEGFPTMMLVSFFLITALMPVLCNFFTESFSDGFKQLQLLFVRIGGGGIP